MANKLSKLVTVSESISIYRYDNGWMIEISGKDKNDNWKTTKTLCNTEEELLSLIKEYNSLNVNE